MSKMSGAYGQKPTQYTITWREAPKVASPVKEGEFEPKSPAKHKDWTLIETRIVHDATKRSFYWIWKRTTV
jgi:hypothetical protein